MTEHANIYQAFLEAQPKFKKPEKNAENKHFGNKYADLEAVVDAVKPALNESNIVFFHTMKTSELGESMVTTLYHAPTGTSMETTVPLLLSKRDMQGLKAAHTYAKRIGLEDITGVAASDDDDADTDRKTGTGMGAALKDAWTQGVLDGISENATPAEKAKAFADAIMAGFEGKKEKALQNEWNRRQKLIDDMEGRFPALYASIVDAYEHAMMKATPPTNMEAAE